MACSLPIWLASYALCRQSVFDTMQKIAEMPKRARMQTVLVTNGHCLQLTHLKAPFKGLTWWLAPAKAS